MACTEAVETVIGEHYNDQIRELIEIPEADLSPEERKAVDELRECISKFRNEELEHLDTAVEQGSGDANDVGMELLKGVVRGGCRVAIEVAKRV